jgi:hypothetical protein
MGQLRDGILGLDKMLKSVSEGGTALADRLEKQGEVALTVRENIYGGHELITQYLDAKLKKKNMKLSERGADKLSVHWDSELAKYVKGIEDACKDANRVIDAWDQAKGTIDGDLARFKAAHQSVVAQLEKKRSKLFQSKKYKDKLATYDRALKELESASTKRFTELTALKCRVSKDSVKKLLVTKDTPLKDLAGVALQGVLREWEKGNLQLAPRKWRENGDLVQAQKALQAWAQEAEDMDREAMAPEERKGPRKLKNVTLWKGATQLASTATATFEAGKPLALSNLVWKTVAKPLDLLQKPITVKADFDPASEGKLANDMKLSKISADFKTATLG